MPQRTPDYQPGYAIPGTVYRVHKVIGSGGMGTVYEVEDTTVGKRYVLKTLHADLADRSDLAARLAREARALAKLQHPNIVEVYTSGTTQDSARLPYYVMERMHGQPLRVVLEKKGHLIVEHALDIGIDLLDALDHAHEFGIIHRDVKPDNIFITRGRDGRSLAKLLDFGIIKLAGPGASTTMATGGRFIGTFRYAPPEQILGRDVTPQSDLYSAGLVLYEMLAGRGPFDDFTGEMEIGKAHIDIAPPMLSRFVSVPVPVEQLVMSALDKDPTRRPRDAFTFASALRDFKKQLANPVVSGPISKVPTVHQLDAQPQSAARPATPFGAQQSVIADVAMPQSAPETRIDAPAGKRAPTAAAAHQPYSNRSQTLSLGVRPQLAPAPETYAAAPLAMGNAEPQHAAPIDRRAETRAAPPQEARGPMYDTAPIPLAVLARPPSTAPSSETFGAHTTEASQRRKSARSAFLIVGIVGVLFMASVGVGGFVFYKRHQATATTPIATATETKAIATTPTATETPVAVTATATETVTVAATVTATETPTATATPHTTAPTHTATSTAAPPPTHTAAIATPPPATNLVPTATATTTATTRHRPGSGL